jgi:hypothetical protein
MKFILETDMDNEAFGSLPFLELARILKETAEKFEEYDRVAIDLGGTFSKIVRDYYGNTVGTATVIREEE